MAQRNEDTSTAAATTADETAAPVAADETALVTADAAWTHPQVIDLVTDRVTWVLRNDQAERVKRLPEPSLLRVEFDGSVVRVVLRDGALTLLTHEWIHVRVDMVLADNGVSASVEIHGQPCLIAGVEYDDRPVEPGVVNYGDLVAEFV